MTEADYHRYIEAFNARDYATLETFFADDFALENAGFRVEGKPAFRAFYAFFRVTGRADTERLALELIDRANVGLAPGSAFGPGGEAHLRLCFLRREADLGEAVARLARVLPDLAT